MALKQSRFTKSLTEMSIEIRQANVPYVPAAFHGKQLGGVSLNLHQSANLCAAAHYDQVNGKEQPP